MFFVNIYSRSKYSNRRFWPGTRLMALTSLPTKMEQISSLKADITFIEQKSSVFSENLVSVFNNSTVEDSAVQQPTLIGLGNYKDNSCKELISCLRKMQEEEPHTKKVVHWDPVLENISVFVDENRDLISAEKASVPLKTIWPSVESSLSEDDTTSDSGGDNLSEKKIISNMEETSRFASVQNEENTQEKRFEGRRRPSLDLEKLRKDIERVKFNHSLEMRSRSAEDVNEVLFAKCSDKAVHESLPSNLNYPHENVRHPAANLRRFVVSKVCE